MAAAAFCIGFATTAHCGEFSLASDQRWVICDTRADLDQAIGAARYYSSDQRSPVVMKQADGRYAVVVGPVSAPAPEKSARDEIARWRPAPRDPKLTNGDEFAAKAWAESRATLAEATLKEEATTPIRATGGALEVELAPLHDRKRDAWSTVVTLRSMGAQALSYTFDGDDYAANGEAAIVPLDASAKTPQLVVSHFTGGSHCCRQTVVGYADADGHWRTIGVDDTERGFGIRDADGDGAAELIGWDEGMLYAFSSYADANPPPRIMKFAKGAVTDATFDPAYRRYMRQRLYEMETGAGADDWKSSGFLAGWVAMKVIVGEGKDGWSKMLANYDHDEPASIERCRISAPIERCPSSKKVARAASFPAALKDYLARHGYPVADLGPLR